MLINIIDEQKLQNKKYEREAAEQPDAAEIDQNKIKKVKKSYHDTEKKQPKTVDDWCQCSCY